MARIAGFAEGSEVLQSHEMVVPAGESREQLLQKGLYNVQLTLPSGRIIQRNVKIDDDSNETYRFFEDFASGPGFSLQESVGRGDVELLADSSGSSAGLGGGGLFADAVDPLDGAGAAGLLAAGEAEAPPSPVLRTNRDPASRRRTVAKRSPPPGRNIPSAAQLAPSMSVGTGRWELESDGPRGDIAWVPSPAQRRIGDSAIWRVEGGLPPAPTRETREWARVQLPGGGVEFASLPLPWMCVGSRRVLPAEILVDPARRGGAATSVAVRDDQLAGLLAFLDRGQAAAAGPLLQELERTNVIEDAISDKMSNPLAACAAAYVGLAAFPPGERERWDYWLGNLMTLFPDVPDAAIVHARRLILRPARSEGNDEVAAALRVACAAGLPFFSAGVFLLRETLTLLVADYGDLKPLAAQAAVLASRVDASQAFTVVRYASGGKGV